MSRQTCAIYSPGALRKHLQQPKIGGMQKKKEKERGKRQPTKSGPICEENQRMQIPPEHGQKTSTSPEKTNVPG